MKICLVNIENLKGTGGGTICTKTIATSLKKRGHYVFLISPVPNSSKSFIEEIQFGIKVYGFHPFGVFIPDYTSKSSTKSSILGRIFTFLLDFWNPHTYFTLKKILKKEKPDIVCIHATIPYLSLSVYSAVRSLNLPTVSTIHSIIYLYPFMNLPYLDKIADIKYPLIKGNYKIYGIISAIYRTINKIIINFNSPDIIVFPTKAIKEIYLKYGFFKDLKNIVFPNMIDTSSINLKNEKIINKKTFDIMYWGGFRRFKGGKTLIKAFRKIENQNIRLHIFGGGEKDVEEYFKKLSEEDKRIIFYGRISNEELQKFYKIADITIVPSECFENFSMTIIESFCAKVPVIGSNVGGNPELIKDGHNGFLFEPGNVEQLKNILEKAINNKEKLKEMGENAFKWVKEIDTEKLIPKLEEIYKEAIESNKRR